MSRRNDSLRGCRMRLRRGCVSATHTNLCCRTRLLFSMLPVLSCASLSTLEDEDQQMKTCIQPCIGAGPEDARLAEQFRQRAVALLDQGRWEDSIPVLHDCLCANPDEVDCYFRLAKAHYELGNTDRFNICYERFRLLSESRALDDTCLRPECYQH